MNMEKFIHMQILNKRTSVLIITVVLMLMCGCTTQNGDIVYKQESGDYVYNFDSRQYQKSADSRAAFTKDGMIMLVNSMLYYYDMSDNQAIPLCSDMTCAHNSIKCKAYAYDNHNYDPYNLNGVDVKCLGNMVWYENDHIYMVERKTSGDYLLEYDTHYNNEKEVKCLTGTGEVLGMPSADTENTAYVYEGYLYFFSVKPTKAVDLVSQDYCTTVYCNRTALDGSSDVEVLGEFMYPIDYYIMGNGSYGKICAGENSVFFVAGSIKRYQSDKNPVQYRIYRYDIDSKSFNKIVDAQKESTDGVLGDNTGNVQGIVNNEIITADNNDSLYIVTDKCRIVQIALDGQVKEIYYNPDTESITSLYCFKDELFFYEAVNGGGNIKVVNIFGDVLGTYSMKAESVKKGSLSDVYIYGIDSDSIYVRMDNNTVSDMINTEMEGKVLKGNNNTDLDIRTYSVYKLKRDDIRNNIRNPMMIYHYEK